MTKHLIYVTKRSEKKIRVGVVFKRLRSILDPDGVLGVDVDDPLDKFFVGANPGLILPDMISNDAGFKGDKIKISVSQLSKASKVSHVIAAVIRQYKKAGWTVYVG